MDDPLARPRSRASEIVVGSMPSVTNSRLLSPLTTGLFRVWTRVRWLARYVILRQLDDIKASLPVPDLLERPEQSQGLNVFASKRHHIPLTQPKGSAVTGRTLWAVNVYL